MKKKIMMTALCCPFYADHPWHLVNAQQRTVLSSRSGINLTLQNRSQRDACADNLFLALRRDLGVSQSDLDNRKLEFAKTDAGASGGLFIRDAADCLLPMVDAAQPAWHRLLFQPVLSYLCPDLVLAVHHDEAQNQSAQSTTKCSRKHQSKRTVISNDRSSFSPFPLFRYAASGFKKSGFTVIGSCSR